MTSARARTRPCPSCARRPPLPSPTYGAQAEKRVDLDSIKAAVEPYLEQAKGYAGAVTDRAEELLATARKDERVARLLDSAESVTGAVVETVQEHVVKPVQKWTGVGATPANTPTEPATVSTVTPATLPAEGRRLRRQPRRPRRPPSRRRRPRRRLRSRPPRRRHRRRRSPTPDRPGPRRSPARRFRTGLRCPCV